MRATPSVADASANGAGRRLTGDGERCQAAVSCARAQRAPACVDGSRGRVHAIFDERGGYA